MAELVARVDELLAADVSRSEAYAAAGTNNATYYRFRAAVRSGELPALRKDWQKLARGWQPRSLAKIPRRQRVHIGRQVAQALRQCYGQSVPASTNASAEAMSAFVSSFERACEAHDLLDDKARSVLEEINEPDRLQRRFADLFEAAKVLTPVLANVAAEFGDHLKEAGHVGSGPRRDPRLGRLVAALTTIWELHAGEVPTHSIDGSTDHPVSPFNKFVLSVERCFLADQKIPKYALIEAMRHACAVRDWPRPFEDLTEGGGDSH